MSNPTRFGEVSVETLLKAGRPLRILAVAVIAVLSTGMAASVYSQLLQRGPLGNMMENPAELLRGFGLLMFLTVGYLMGKSWTTNRFQRRLMEQLLEQKSLEEARNLNPITQFHHPEVCREFLLRQASYADRQNAPISILEVTVSNLAELSPTPSNLWNSDTLIGQMQRRMQSLLRPIDCLLRWTPESFLLVLPEISEDQLPAIQQRIHRKLEDWREERFEATSRPELHLRAVTSTCLGISGDILVQVQRLLDGNDFPSSAPNNFLEALQHAKSVGLALDLQVLGVDQEGRPFQEDIRTERITTDRIWFPMDKKLPERCYLTISSPKSDIQGFATVTNVIQRAGERVVEAQFSKTPDNWVIKCA